MFELIDADGTIFVLDKPVNRLGRSGGDIVFPADDQISNLHAEITVSERGLTVRDLGSTNGTFVNGTPIQAAIPVQAGDVIQIGRVALAIEHRADAPTMVVNVSANDQTPGAGATQPTSNTPQTDAPPIPPPLSAPQADLPPYADSVSQSNKKKDRTACVLLEVLPGLVGFLGIGWIYAGELPMGVAILVGGLAFNLFWGILLLLGGIGLCIAPFWIVAVAVSTIMVHKHTVKHPDRFN